MSSFTAIPAALKAGQLAAAERLSVEWIRQHPHTAQGWVYLGQALLRQGQGKVARAVFERAALLDPQADWVEKIEQVLAQVPPGKDRPDIQRLLATKKVSVAAAILTYNEEETIARCISSLLEAVDEIVVLDSASSDRTLAIVAQFPQVKVIPNDSITDDFAAKRNQALEHIDSDWVLWVDADEWLDEEDRLAVRTAAGCFHNTPLPAALNVTQINHIGDRQASDYSVPRMFQLRRGLHYVGRVHEQLARDGYDLFSSEILRHSVRIRLHHDGYEPEIMRSKDKLQRNLRLLQLMVDEEPDNPGWWLYLGRETLVSGDADRALDILLKAEDKARLKPRFGRLTEIHSLLVSIYVARQQYDDAEAVCMRSLEHQPDFPNMHFQLAQIRMRKASALLKQAEADLQQAKQAFRSYRGLVPADHEIRIWKADATLADLAVLTGNAAQAAKIYRTILAKQPTLDHVRSKLEKISKPDRS